MLGRLIRRIWKAPTEQTLGMLGEKAAEKHLRRSGFKVLYRNYRCHHGEVDLVAREGSTLVFVEVKTRHSEDYGNPSDAVDPQKQLHITRVALDYLRRLNHPQIPVRFDIVEVVYDSKWTCRLIRDAFPLSEPYIY